VPIEIRPVPETDLRRWFDAIGEAFGEDQGDQQFEHERRLLEPSRVLGAYDGDMLAGGGACFSFQLTVPGGRAVPTAGVTSVGIMPSHRRQGALRMLMARQLADVRANGEPLAALWASEGSIYQRFGYGLATLNATVDIARDRATFRHPVEAVGSIELRDGASAREDMVRIFDAVRAVTPGFYTRTPAWWSAILDDPEFRRRGGSKRRYAIHVRDGKAVGYAMYRIKSEWTPTAPASVLMVVELVALDPAATEQLWRYLFGVDLMGSIFQRLGPAAHPLLLMVAEPRRLQLRVSDGLWLRIVDVPEALEARGYATDGSVVLDVTDGFLPEVAGRWRLTVRDGAARATATDERADIELDVTDLAAVYLGGFTFASLARAGRTVEQTPGARELVDALFASAATPWCPEIF
jgi:predicted acetyltransferase